jgi:hypothetical protein
MSTDGTVTRWFPIVLLGATAALFLLVSAPLITAPFGDSDEGINGAVWSTNSRALREAGPIDSRLGGRRLDGSEYATHPPYIVISTAIAETVAGEREWASRAPAWIGALASIGLLYVVVRRAGVSTAAGAAAVAATALTPMLFTYGFMLDTPVVSLPFGIAVLLAWHQRWRAPAGERAWHPLAVGVLCAAAALAGWQAAVLTGLAGLVLLIRALRGDAHPWREALPFLIGGAVGVALSLSWTWWVYGDFSTLGDKFFRRSGESNTVGLGDMVSFQIPWVVQLLGVGIVGLGACIAALWDRRMRALAAMSLGIVVLYAVAFRQAAAGHQYWNYWVLIPTAVGFAWAFERLRRDVPARAGWAVLTGACVVIGVVNLAVLDDEARRYIDQGYEIAELVIDQPRPADQEEIAYVGQSFRPDAWLSYYTGLHPVPLRTTEDVVALGREHPDHQVVVLGWCDEGDSGYELCRELVERHQDLVVDGSLVRYPRLERAGDLASRAS